jgi:transcriptional regulator with XRE-family HTH domain
MTIGINRSKRASELLAAEFGPLTVARLLLAHRDSLAISQAAMAKKLKVSSQKLCDFEKGRRLPSPQTAERWASILGVSPQVWVEAVLREQIQGCKTISQVTVA